MRERVVVQPADVQDGDSEVHRRLHVRRVECARFRRMLVNPQVQMEGSRDVGDRAFHIQNQAVGMRGGHRQAVGLREVHERLIVLFGRPKARGELLTRKIAVIIGAGRVAELLAQLVEFILVAQRQANGQIQTLRARKAARGSQARQRRRDVTANQFLPGLRAPGNGQSHRQQRNRSHQVQDSPQVALPLDSRTQHRLSA